MSEIDLGTDLGDIKVRNGVADGDYLLEVIELTHHDAKSEGKNPWLRLNAVIVAARSDAEGGPESVGLRASDLFTLSPNAMWRIKEFLSAAYDREFTGSKIPNDIVGRRFTARVYTETFENKDRTKIVKFRPVSAWTGDAPVQATNNGASVPASTEISI